MILKYVAFPEQKRLSEIECKGNHFIRDKRDCGLIIIAN